MNEKRAKALREAAQYRNQSKTPGTMPFPGIFPRGYRLPAVERRTKKVRIFNRTPGQPRKYREVTSIVHSGRIQRVGKFWIPIPVVPMIQDKKTGQMIQKFEIMPVSKPGRLNEKEPKGIYRKLKRLDRKFNIKLLVENIRDMGGISAEAIIAAQKGGTE